MSELVSLTRTDNIGIITINNPPVNALSPGVPEGIGSAIDAAQSDAATKAIVLIGSGRTFIAGADIREFGKITSGEKSRGPGLLPLLLKIEDCPKPFVCAIHGTAFGGGLEVALACHYRVAVPTAQVGQPEVKLGIIPGAAGTQRLPRLAGVAKALEMCALGDPVQAPQALEVGIVDKIVEGDLLAGALVFARDLLARGEGPRKTRDRNEKLGDQKGNAALFGAARELAARKARGMMAPHKAIDAVEAATRLSFEEGCKREAELFQECLYSGQSKAMIHVFFGEREVAKIPGLPRKTPVLEVRKAAVVGAGTMGSGIAMVYANAGIPVVLKEVSKELLDRGIENIKRNYDTSVRRGRFTQQIVDKRMALIHPTLSYDEFGEVDIAVEAVFEGMEVKKQVFSELDQVCKPDVILASNTSTLDIDQIASATQRPERVIGHHFFAPANVMRLMEVVRGKASANDVIASSMALARRLGKIGVLVGNCRGFVGNRMYHYYQREAQFLVEEGASVDEVDGVLYHFGMAMGPLATADLSGLDVGWRIRQEYRHLETPGRRRPVVADRLCELRRFGQKTGAGWYRYNPNDRTRTSDPEVEEIIEECSRAAGIERRTIAPEEIIERTIYALVNEGARILEEGFALRAVDIDIIYLNGYGFPVYRGGPMWYADTVGLDKVYQRILDFQRQHGNLWQPAPLLKQLAEQGKTFADFDKTKSATAAADAG
jgi:3-hydroxyacyl-CoA dehydrogenase